MIAAFLTRALMSHRPILLLCSAFPLLVATARVPGQTTGDKPEGSDGRHRPVRGALVSGRRW